MSENPISLLSSKIDTIILLKRLAINHVAKFDFLLAWHEVIADKDRPFGFIGVAGFEEQAQKAIDFILDAEKEWHKEVLTKGKDRKLEDIYILRAKDAGLDLPYHFLEKIFKKMEEIEKWT